jgi:hypothetical protein
VLRLAVPAGWVPIGVVVGAAYSLENLPNSADGLRPAVGHRADHSLPWYVACDADRAMADGGGVLITNCSLVKMLRERS